jgi:hypothetical protein
VDHFIRRASFVVAAIILGRIAMYFLITPGATLVHNARMGEWKKAEVREACFEALENLNDPNLPHYQSDIATADGLTRATEMTAALHCYIVTKRDAVCKPDERAYIVDYIGRYYDKMDSMMASAKRRGPDQLKLMKEFWNSRRNQQIASTIEAAVRDGKLNKSDFGWSTPAALKPMLDQNAKAADRCPPQRSAARNG